MFPFGFNALLLITREREFIVPEVSVHLWFRLGPQLSAWDRDRRESPILGH